MDDLFDDVGDLLDPSSPAGMAALAIGILGGDDEYECSCWCQCGRRAEPPDDMCEPCQEDRHKGDDR